MSTETPIETTSETPIDLEAPTEPIESTPESTPTPAPKPDLTNILMPLALKSANMIEGQKSIIMIGKNNNENVYFGYEHPNKGVIGTHTKEIMTFTEEGVCVNGTLSAETLVVKNMPFGESLNVETLNVTNDVNVGGSLTVNTRNILAEIDALKALL